MTPAPSPARPPDSDRKRGGPKPSGGGTGGAVAFGRIPYGPIDAGLVAQMTGADAKVYLAIAAHANGTNWTAKPSLDRLATLTGLARPSVVRAVRRLESIGAIETQSGGGRARGTKDGRSNIYRLSANSNPAVTVSKGNRGDTVGRKRSPSRAHTVTPEPSNSNPPVTRTDSNSAGTEKKSAPRTDKTKTESETPTRGQLFVDELIQVAPSVAFKPGTKKVDGRILGIARLVDSGELVEVDHWIDQARRMHEGWAGPQDGKAKNGHPAAGVFARTVWAHINRQREEEAGPKTIGELVCELEGVG